MQARDDQGFVGSPTRHIIRKMTTAKMASITIARRSKVCRARHLRSCPTSYAWLTRTVHERIILYDHDSHSNRKRDDGVDCPSVEGLAPAADRDGRLADASGPTVPVTRPTRPTTSDDRSM